MVLPSLCASSGQATIGTPRSSREGDVSRTQLLHKLALTMDPFGLFYTHLTLHTEIVENLADVCDSRIEIETIELFAPFLLYTTRPYEGLLK